VPVQLVVPTRENAFVSLELLDGIGQWVDQLWAARTFSAGHWLQLSHPELVVRYVSGIRRLPSKARRNPPACIAPACATG